MQDFLIKLLTRSTKIIVIVTFIAVFISLTSLIVSINKNYGLNFFIKAEDFTAYYTASKMITAGDGNKLYDLNTQMNYQLKYTENIFTFRPFINPPFVALFFLPFSVFSLNYAYLIWLIINFVLLILIIKSLVKNFIPKANFKKLIPVFLLIILFPPVFITLISGQISFFLLLAFLMARNEYILGHKGKTAVWLSLLFLKPQYIFLPFLYFLHKKEYKILAVFIAATSVFEILSFVTVGAYGIKKYFDFITSIFTWADINTVTPTLTFSLRGFLQLIFQNNSFETVVLYWILAVISIILLVFYIWNKKIKNTLLKQDIDWSVMIVGAALITPYTSGQDILILIFPAVLVYYWGSKLKLNKYFKDLTLIFLMVGYIITIMAGFFVIYLRIQALVLYLISCLFILLYIIKKHKISNYSLK